MKGYSDSDWGGDISTRRSTSGYIFLLNNNITSWCSSLQKTVALSSCEAEYMGTKEAIKENIYLYNVITEINKVLNLNLINDNYIPILLLDNQSSMKLAENAEFHKRTKHIDIQYHFIRECVENNKVRIGYIPTNDQLADGLTKGFNSIKQKQFVKILNLV